MIRYGPVPAFSITLILLFAPGASGQRLSAITGQILDPSGARVPEAAVSIVHQETGFRRAVSSDPGGEYTIGSLHPGVYKITVRKEGFRTMIRFGVRVDAAQAARVDFSLAVGSTQEVITVEGTAVQTRTDDASVNSRVERTEAERLPVNGGGVSSLLELTPGVLTTPATRGEAGQFSAGGQRPNTNYFTVDGASANSGVIAGGSPARPSGGSLPGYSAIGSLHSMIPMEALDEMTVRTSSAGSEFGRLPGAQVSLQSRAGTNEFHGSGVYYFRHENLAANDWFANGHNEGTAPLRAHDFAASLGGPAIRNRTFFFAAYEGLRLRQPFAWSNAVPSTAFRASAPAWMKPLLDSYPIANGADLGRGLAEWTGRNNRPSSLDSGTVRVDQMITSRVTAFARYNDSPSQSEFGNTLTNRLDIRAQSGTAALTLQASEWVFDSRVNLSRIKAESAGKTAASTGFDACGLQPVITQLTPPADACQNLIRFSIAGTTPLSFGPEGIRQQGQFQAAQSARLDRGNHSLRMGVDYRRLTPEREDAGGTISFIADSFESLGLNRWTGQGPRISGEAALHEVSLYLQNTWRVLPGLTATMGVRWEISPPPEVKAPANFLDFQTAKVTQQQRPIWPMDWTYLAPRVGLAYRPGKGGTVLRGGAGVYYDSSLSLATDLVSGGPFATEEFKNPLHAPLSTTFLRYGFLPNLKLPVVTQWNVAVEQTVGGAGVASATYLGSYATRLIRREVGGQGSSERDWWALATNHGESSYQGLQLQFVRRFAGSWQGRGGYTWSHSIDDSSSEALLHWAGGGVSAASDRGSSDFDVRHSVTGTLSYEVPSRMPVLLRGWGVDSIFRARSGFPVTVLDSDHYLGVSLANAFRPNLIPGVPVWLDDANAAGKRRINAAAFQVLDGVQGNLGRNALTGFGMWQLDTSLRREIQFGEKRTLEIRAEAFNILNHPNFADPTRYLVNPLFGKSTSMLNLMLGTGTPGSGLAPVFQSGGPRSLQFMMRFRF